MISGGAEDGGEKREPPPSHYYSPSYSGGEGNGNPLQYSSLEPSYTLLQWGGHGMGSTYGITLFTWASALWKK